MVSERHCTRLLVALLWASLCCMPAAVAQQGSSARGARAESGDAQDREKNDNETSSSPVAPGDEQGDDGQGDEVNRSDRDGNKGDDNKAMTDADRKVEETIEGIPDSDKPGRSREAIDRMRQLLSKVLQHLEEARDERDVVKLNCVNEKLTAVKGLLRISEQADVSLQEALARRNAEAAHHEFEKIIIAQRKTEQLTAESEACVGELAVYSGDTELEVVVEGVPEGDPTEDIRGPPPTTRPPAASPYQ